MNISDTNQKILDETYQHTWDQFCEAVYFRVDRLVGRQDGAFGQLAHNDDSTWEILVARLEMILDKATEKE